VKTCDLGHKKIYLDYHPLAEVTPMAQAVQPKDRNVPVMQVTSNGMDGPNQGQVCATISVAVAQASYFQKMVDIKSNKIDKNVKIFKHIDLLRSRWVLCQH
jgi:hypothetical protein